jgi:hypothetical protein
VIASVELPSPAPWREWNPLLMQPGKRQFHLRLDADDALT